MSVATPTPAGAHAAGAAEHGPAPVVEHPTRRVDVLALLGLLAHTELSAFDRLTADALLAPTWSQRLELRRLAAAELGHADQVIARIEELGGDPEQVMAPFAGVFAEFEVRTATDTWYERLLRAHVGYAVADDFCRLAARALDQESRALVEDVLSRDRHADLVVAELTSAAEQDPRRRSRLALWGRRLVGESLGVVQHAVARHPGLLDLAAGSDAEPGGSTRVFAELTGEHTRRMDRLGLTA